MTKPNFETNVVKPQTSITVNDEIYNLISSTDETALDKSLKEIEDFMEKNDGSGLTEEEKDTIYADAQNLYKESFKLIRDNTYKFYLNRSQYNFLTDLLLSKLEYDVENIFIAIELTSLLAGMKDYKYKNEDELNGFDVTATEMTYIYHLISKYKVKGLSKTAYTFSSLLMRIGDLSKLINYYDAYIKNLNTEIQKWAVSLGGEDVVVDDQQ